MYCINNRTSIVTALLIGGFLTTGCDADGGAKDIAFTIVDGRVDFEASEPGEGDDMDDAPEDASEETEEEVTEEEVTEEEVSEEEVSEEEVSEEEVSEEEVSEEEVSEEEVSEEEVSEEEVSEATVYSGALALDIIVYSLGGPGEPSADGCVTDVEFVVDPGADSEVAWSGYCYLEANSIGLTFIGTVVDDELVEGELRFAMNGRDVVMPWTGFLTEGELSGTFDTTWNYLPGTMNIDIEGDFFGER